MERQRMNGRRAQVPYHLVGKYKSRSIFVRILFILLVYSAVLLVVLFLYNSHMLRRNVEQRLELRTLGVLERTQESVDRELKNLSGQIRQLSRDEYITAEMTAPNISNAVRNYDIVYQLQTAQAINGLVSGAFLYVPTDDTFFSSEGTAAEAAQYQEDENAWALIEACRNFGKNAGEEHLVMMGEAPYLLLNAPYFYDRVLGVLAFRIDARALVSLIEGESETGERNTIWVYDEAGNPLFADWLSYPKDLTPEAVTALGTASGDSDGSGGDYYKRISRLNGWQYLLSTDFDVFTAEAAGLDKGLLLIILGLSVFCVVFSVYLSGSVYLPIQKVIGIAGHEGDRTGGERNELELLERSVSDTVTKNQQMKDFLETIRPSMVSDTFRNLLAGREVEREKLDEHFAVLKTEFRTNLNYSLGVIGLVSQREDFSSVECNILFHRLEQEILMLSQGKFLCSFVHMLQNNNLAVVMGVTEEVSVKQMKLWQQEVGLHLQSLCQAYPVKCVVRFSRRLSEITELHRVFSDICRELNYGIYLQDHEAEDKREVERLVILQILGEIKERIDNGTEEGLSPEALTRALMAQKETPAERKRTAVLWWEAVVELLIPLNVFGQEELNQERERLFEGPEEDDAFFRRLNQFNEKVIEGMRTGAGRMKKRYVERAKQYIEEHYSEAELSLTSISDILGISQSYLSSQFKKETGTNFLEYVNRYRIERSRMLLQMTELTVEEIGFKTGFTSAKNFARVFKKYTETSPGAYREDMKRQRHG